MRPGTSGLCGPSGGWEAHTPVTLSLESALDDLDLNEFGVAALEKTFDNSTVPHPGSITIGTGHGWAGWLGRAPGVQPGPGVGRRATPCSVWPRVACPALTRPCPSLGHAPHLATLLGLSCRRQFAAELRTREHPWLLEQLCFLPLSIPVPSCQPLLAFPAAAPGPPEPVRKHIFGDVSITWIFG